MSLANPILLALVTCMTMATYDYQFREVDRRVSDAQAPSGQSGQGEATNLSGAHWTTRFEGSNRIEDLDHDFGAKVRKFVDALGPAGARVSVTSTRRTLQRQYLMFGAWMIGHEGMDPRGINAAAQVTDEWVDSNIGVQWVHRSSSGEVDLVASRKAAAEMVARFKITGRPAVPGGTTKGGQHCRGYAVDLDIKWDGDLSFSRPGEEGKPPEFWIINTEPRDQTNSGLAVLAQNWFGVLKNPRSPNHWSVNGK